MSGHSVAPQLKPIVDTIAATDRRPGEFVETRGNKLVGMRVTIMIDIEDWSPAAIDERMAAVRKTIDEFIGAKRR